MYKMEESVIDQYLNDTKQKVDEFSILKSGDLLVLEPEIICKSIHSRI
jgi:hypothetical protein